VGVYLNAHSYFLSLHALRVLVVDEADRMLTSGHFKELQVLFGPLYLLHYALLPTFSSLLPPPSSLLPTPHSPLPTPCFRVQPLEHAACSAVVSHFFLKRDYGCRHSWRFCPPL
jgi:hypothetical protein